MSTQTWKEYFNSLFSPKDLQSEGFNPQKGKIGQSVGIDDIDYNLNWQIKRIHQYKSDLGEYADYDIAAAKGMGYVLDYVKAKLRYLAEKTYLLVEYDHLSFDEGLYDVLTHSNESMKVDDDEINLHEEYRRPRMRGEYKADVRTLEDKNNDGIVDKSELAHSVIRLWDYERNTTEEGIAVKQYLFVEMAPDRSFTLYRGKEINSSKVTFY